MHRNADMRPEVRPTAATARTANADANAGDRSSSRPVVVIQQPAESCTALNFSGAAADFRARVDDAVLQALVIPFCVVREEGFGHGVSQ